MTMTIEATEGIPSKSLDIKPESSTEKPVDDESELMNSESDGISSIEPDSPVEHNQMDRADDEIPEGDSNADMHALLLYSRKRLEQQGAATLPDVEESGDIAEDESGGSQETADGDIAIKDTPRQFNSDEEQLVMAKAKMAEADAKAAADDDYMESLREEVRFYEQAETTTKHEIEQDVDKDPTHLLKLAELKVRQAEEKARQDEEATCINVIKPAVSTTKRSEANSELWALLNYSKMRLETGATPQLGKKRDLTRGDDVSVSSKGTKMSVSSKTSIASRSVASGSKAPISIIGALDDGVKGVERVVGENEGNDVPFPDVTGEDASVDDSVSVDDEQESMRDKSDEEDSDSDGSEEEENELPSFLKDDNEEDEVDPAEVKRLYEEAKLKAASILSVDQNLTEVQMLQAMAIAVEAANNGEDKFSTKRSLFRLNEAKLDDLKSFLDFSGMNRANTVEQDNAVQTTENEHVGWGIGRGRLIKKLGAAFRDLKDKCDEIDERKQKERKSQRTHTEILNAAYEDLKKQIDEYEKIVKFKR